MTTAATQITNEDFAALSWPDQSKVLRDLSNLSCAQEGRTFGEAQRKRAPIDKRMQELQAIHDKQSREWIMNASPTKPSAPNAGTMTTAAFDPDRATGTLLFAHGGRMTPALSAVLGALAFDPAAAEKSSPYLPFSGESSATWGAVLDHLSARGRELGLSTPATTRDSAQLLDWMCAFAVYTGARPSGVKSLLGHSRLTLEDRASVEDLVALAKLLDDGHGLYGYRIEEYSINVTNGRCAPWNPFEYNFASQAAAEQAAEQFLLEDEEYTEAVIGKVVIVDNEIQTDDAHDSLATIRRADLVDAPAAPAP